MSAAIFRSNDKNFVHFMSIFILKPDFLAHFRVEHFLTIFDFNPVAIFPYYTEFCIQSGDIPSHWSHSWRVWWPLWSHLEPVCFNRILDFHPTTEDSPGCWGFIRILPSTRCSCEIWLLIRILVFHTTIWPVWRMADKISLGGRRIWFHYKKSTALQRGKTALNSPWYFLRN